MKPVHRHFSRGAFEFYHYAGPAWQTHAEIRQCVESGDMARLSGMMHPEITMVSYDMDFFDYRDLSIRPLYAAQKEWLYKPREEHRECIRAFCSRTFRKFEEVYADAVSASQSEFLEQYCPIGWTTGDVTENQLYDVCRAFLETEYDTLEIYMFALSRTLHGGYLKTKRGWRGCGSPRKVLWARRDLLEKTARGRSMMNIYRVMDENIFRIYGITPYGSTRIVDMPDRSPRETKVMI